MGIGVFAGALAVYLGKVRGLLTVKNTVIGGHNAVLMRMHSDGEKHANF
jgi:hypothetical protein